MISIDIKIPIKGYFLNSLDVKLTDKHVRNLAETDEGVGYYIPRWDGERLKIVFDYYYSNDVLADTLDIIDIDLTTLEYYK